MALHANKPFIMEEIGLNTVDSGYTEDPTGIYLHTSGWASLMAKAGCGALAWWWDTYINPYSLYYRYRGLAAFTAGEDLDQRNYSPVKPDVSTSTSADYLVSPGHTAWMVPAPANSFTVNTNGSMSPSESSLGSRLYGPWKASAMNPPAFTVNYPVAGKFKVSALNENSAGSNGIGIHLDGTPLLNQNPATMGTTYEIDVPAGLHTIYVYNSGNDWVDISYSFTNYTSILRCFALNGNDKILGWVQSRNFTFWQQYNSEPLPLVSDGVIQFTGVSSDGNWHIRWFETLNGIQTSSSNASASGGNLSIPVPAVSTDIAFKADWTGGVIPSPTITPIVPTPTITPTAVSDPADENLDKLYIYPSLFNVSQGHTGIYFKNLGSKIFLKIFNINGDIVHQADIDTPSGEYFWDLSSLDGSVIYNKKKYNISSGIYIYYIKDRNGNIKIGKFAIIK